MSFASFRVFRGRVLLTTAALTLAVLAGMRSECRAKDVFFFDTPPAKRGAAARANGPAAGVAAFMAAGPAAQVVGNDPKQRAVPIFAQFKPSIQVELSFAARVCELEGADRDAVVKAAKDELWAFAMDLAKDPNRLQQFQQGVWIVRNRRAVQQPGAEASIDDRAIAAIKPAIPAAKRERYEAEREKRRLFRRETTIDCIVAQLDDRLALTKKQRENIAAALERGWDQSWAPQLSQFVQMEQYLPSIPEEFVTPHLTAEQKVVYRGIDKMSMGGMQNGFQQMFPGMGQPIGDVDMGEDP